MTGDARATLFLESLATKGRNEPPDSNPPANSGWSENTSLPSVISCLEVYLTPSSSRCLEWTSNISIYPLPESFMIVFSRFHSGEGPHLQLIGVRRVNDPPLDSENVLMCHYRL